MSPAKRLTLSTPLGKRDTDSTGSPIGVAHLDATRSYAGVGDLLADYINSSRQSPWEQIKDKIDYTYNNIDPALDLLDKETGFSREIKARAEKGQKLLFKPNLVGPMCIDPQTHLPGGGYTTCTAWPFVAALMRWIHDRLDLTYHQMCIGEAATGLASAAGMCTLHHGRTITTEAIIEGRSDNFYGGWGFYFVRKYLAETHSATHRDDPMAGYMDSISGRYIPPGHATDRLMVYDLNRISDDPYKGREIKVPDGINFKSIVLHKAIVGGDRKQPRDIIAYPGAVLINVPKLKVHIMALLTNAIKNLGIGLYPMQCTTAGGCQWDYAIPHAPIPGIKGGIPHQIHVPEMDIESGLPLRDSKGQYITARTGGINATMADIIKAVASQDVYMLHVVDGIETTNLDHQGSLPGIAQSEGMVFAGLDPVATDQLCARFLFSNVPFAEAETAGLKDNAGGAFPQRVPLPNIENGQIVTGSGLDCSLARDRSLQHAERRGLGKRKYYVTGVDTISGGLIVSVAGHLGTVRIDTFLDLITKNLYFDVYKIPWDMQKTAFSYWECVDKLTGTSLKRDFLAAFDEDKDGIVNYDEYGNKGLTGLMLHWGGRSVSLAGSEPLGYLRGGFQSSAALQKYSESSWNMGGHEILKEYQQGLAVMVALRLSQMETEMPDPFVPGLTWGKGKWPSLMLTIYLMRGSTIYGAVFPNGVGLAGLYGAAFRYADRTQNEARYCGAIRSRPNADAVTRYFEDIKNGGRQLDFTVYVPAGFGSVGGTPVPNVVETLLPDSVLTAAFPDGEKW